MQANSCTESDGLAHRALAYGLSLHHSTADSLDPSTHVCTHTRTFARAFSILGLHLSHINSFVFKNAFKKGAPLRTQWLDNIQILQTFNNQRLLI